MARCQAAISEHQKLQEVHDFCRGWAQSGIGGGGSSLEMGFYRDTWRKIENFQDIIRKVPTASSKAGTILVETNTLKK